MHTLQGTSTHCFHTMPAPLHTALLLHFLTSSVHDHCTCSAAPSAHACLLASSSTVGPPQHTALPPITSSSLCLPGCAPTPVRHLKLCKLPLLCAHSISCARSSYMLTVRAAQHLHPQQDSPAILAANFPALESFDAIDFKSCSYAAGDQLIYVRQMLAWLAELPLRPVRST